MNVEVHEQQNGVERGAQVGTQRLLQHHRAACCLQGCFQFLCLFFGYVGSDFLGKRLHQFLGLGLGRREDKKKKTRFSDITTSVKPETGTLS